MISPSHDDNTTLQKMPMMKPAWKIIWFSLLALLLGGVSLRANNVSMSGKQVTAEWNWWDTVNYWYTTYDFSGTIVDHVLSDGNIGFGSTRANWVEPNGTPIQGDGRYAHYTGHFELRINFYVEPNHLREVTMMIVHFTDGAADFAWSGYTPGGSPDNSGPPVGPRRRRRGGNNMSTAGGPVEIASGGETATRPLFAFSGARQWGFGISYDSIFAELQQNVGAVGNGWTHPFETQVIPSGANLLLQWDQIRSNIFTPKPGDPSTFVSTDEATQYDVITTQTGGGWLLTFPDQSSRLFSASGRLLEDRDPQGRKLVLTYDGSNRIATIADPISSTSLAFAYVSGSPRIESITDASGATVAFSYGGDQMLNQIVNQNSKQVTFTYNSTRALLTLADHNGAILTTNTMDKFGRVSAQDDGVTGNQSLAFSYEEHGMSGNNLYAPSDTAQAVPLQLPDPQYFWITSYTGLNGQAISYAYDGNGRLTTATVNSQTTTVGYDAQGNASSITDPAAQTSAITPGIAVTVTDRTGQQSLYSFDANEHLLSFKNPLNQTKSYTYDAHGNILSVTDALSHAAAFTYDASGNVLTTTDAAGKVATFTYDARNNLLTTTDPANKTTTRTYDTKNNLLTLTDALGRTTTWTYDTNSLPLTMTLPRGGVYTYAYTAGRLTQVTDPNGVITRFGYNANGVLLYREDALGKRTTYTYDAIGNVLTATNALNQTLTYAYDHRNHLTSVTDPAGGVTAYTYDNNQNLLTATNALGKVTTYTYDGEDRLKTITDPLSRVTTYAYDDAGRLTSVTDPAGHATAYEYDAAAELTAVQDALGHRATATFDARGLPLTLTDPLSRAQTFTYDDLGRRLSAKDPLNRTTTLTYDPLHRVTTVTDPGSLVSAQGFDTDGDRTSTTNPTGNATAFAFDAGNRLTSVTTPEGRVTTQTYDARGFPSTVTAPSSQTTTFGYDDAARLAAVTDSLGAVTLGRDNTGRLLTVTEGTKVLTREYDLLGRMTKYTDGDGNVISYGYDVLNRLTTLTYPDLKQVSYAYDTAGRLQSVTDWASRVTTYAYDAMNRLTLITRPNGTTQTRTYDAAGQLTQLHEFAPDGTTLIYSGDYSYDAASQLTGETLIPALVATAYNATQTFDRDNRLLTHNGQTVTSDANGNLLSVASGLAPASYTYDARNRLTGAGALTYAYNAENRRVALTDATGTTHYAINPNAILDQVLVRTAPDGTKTFYVYGLGLAHEETGSSVRYYHHDRRGDTVALTDGTGAVTDRMSYGVYGEVVSRLGASNTPFLFNGRWGVQTDANGLYYHRARYYHPALRRFLNQDGVLGSIASGASLNRFAYANGNPVSLIDPFGLAASDGAPNGSGPLFPGPISASVFYVVGPNPAPVPGPFNGGPNPIPDNGGSPYPVDPNSVRSIASDAATAARNAASDLWGAAVGQVKAAAAIFAPVGEAVHELSRGVGMGADYLLPGSGQSAQNLLALLPVILPEMEIGSLFDAAAAETGAADSSLLAKYLNGSGGRWGGTATRLQNDSVATSLEDAGYQVTGGAGRAAEEWIPGTAGGTKGGTFVDLTATDGVSTVRVQTISTLSNGAPTAAEAAAAARIRAAFPNDHLILVPKWPK